MNEVFDLASGNFNSSKLLMYNAKRRKKCVVHEPESGKIKVTFTTEYNQKYSCIYIYRSNEEVYDMIKRGQPLNLRFTYIKDFDIAEVDTLVDYNLNDFDAFLSFWDGEVDFSGAKFGDGYVNYDSAHFGDGYIDFRSAHFGNGDIDFSYAHFGDGYVDFNWTHFGNGNVTFRSTNFGDGDVDFSSAHFGNGDIDFSYAQFGNGHIDFSYSSAQSIIFLSNTFSSHVDLRLNTVSELIIEDCIIEKTLKCRSSVSYKKLSFYNTINLGQIHINWDSNGLFDAINNGMKPQLKATDKGETIYFTLEELFDSFNKEIKTNKAVIPFTSEEKASQFRMLKENFHNIGYYDNEDKAYRAYMKFKTNSLKRCWMKIFGLIGGYGTQAWKVILAALAVIAGFGGIFTAPMQLAETLPTDITFSCSFFKGLYFSAITFLTIGYGDISPPNQTVALLAGIEGFLGLFLMSYFTVCVVRKLLR